MATNWMMISIIIGVVGVTLLVIGIGAIGYSKILRNRRFRAQRNNGGEMNPKVKQTLSNDEMDRAHMNPKVRNTLDSDAINSRMSPKVKNTLDNDKIDSRTDQNGKVFNNPISGQK